MNDTVNRCLAAIKIFDLAVKNYGWAMSRKEIHEARMRIEKACEVALMTAPEGTEDSK